MQNHLTDKNDRHQLVRNGQKPQTGILEWFHINEYQQVEEAVKELKRTGITHLRTGVSWADYHTEDGEKWYDWLIPLLSENFELLPCFLYTPPNMGVEPQTSAPPKNPKDYADFLDLFINRHGEHFEYVELWNEPNNQSEYDYKLDKSWDIFADMVIKASYWAKHLGKKTVLGGMSPVDPNWLRLMIQKNVLENIDVIGFHGFPEIFESHWQGWEKEIRSIKNVLHEFNLERELWITETGYSTWRFDDVKQIEKFTEVMQAQVSRVYWYSLTDLNFSQPTITGHHSDEREYHFGMIQEDGTKKLLYRLLETGGVENVLKNRWMADRKFPVHNKNEEHVLVTGGAGFIGTNLADRLLSNGIKVTVFDNLSRPGVEKNLQWLKTKHGDLLNVLIADVRDRYMVEKVVQQVSHIFHFAAQVAVTTSLENPRHDFSVNVQGTVNMLEAIRKTEHKPSLLYTSTNKVYGNLEDIQIKNNTTRYLLQDKKLAETGIDEQTPLNFHSPYGSSKGAADQYVLDYTKSFDLKNVVFRMSCIYGPHQFGTEDQGWVAHFILKALKNEKIFLFGDGMQVRDILYVDDLVNAMIAAWQNIGQIKGEAFNIGGGVKNTVSLLELIKILENLENRKIPLVFKEWRRGDQKYYVSDTSKFNRKTGWEPQMNHEEGVRELYHWLKAFRRSSVPVTTKLLVNNEKVCLHP